MAPPIVLDPSTTCNASRAEICFCDPAATTLGAIVIATATSDSIDGVVVRVDSIHGKPGGIAVGQSLTLPSYVDAQARAGDALFISVLPNPARPDNHTIRATFQIDGDKLALDDYCSGAPRLSTAHAIEAALAMNCATHLAGVNASWGESHCDGGGCSIGAGGANLLGTVLVTALVTRRIGRRTAAS